MKSGLKKYIVLGAFLMAPLSLAFANVAQAGHPDGVAVTYRGWGDATKNVTPGGHRCPLFDALGIKVGDVVFPDQDHGTLTILGKSATFTKLAPGVVNVQPLDDDTADSFPNLPAEYLNGNYALMTYEGRYEVGENLTWGNPNSPLARLISAIDARCVYVVDAQGNILFCLNCIFSLS